MQHQFKVTDTFQKDIKWLKKKYPNVLKDLSETLTIIDNDSNSGDRIEGLNKLIFRIRIPSRDMNKGKSGGFGTIYYVVTEHKEIILLTIYAKSKQENIMPSRIEEILKTL
ncbi:hypothetical protein HBE96_21975 [Clostridium sp. P21]|uniref:Uncharacterized protein n=1 Tax=Clostridium muellerianum TaxID=2716538 RepID=A0A7Y0EKV1_9CLOT|nr:hypothetical protein [Clostridium muellerianum]NMM65256.1 hypothetical protein [Clostridium muellerianum]